jgi:hypothetical protein
MYVLIVIKSNFRRSKKEIKIIISQNWSGDRNYFFVVVVGLWSWLVDKLHVHPYLWSWIFISQPSSKSTLPLAGLLHMQQCQVDLIQMNGAWKMVSWGVGLNPRPLSHESSALTTRPRLLAKDQNYCKIDQEINIIEKLIRRSKRP